MNNFITKMPTIVTILLLTAFGLLNRSSLSVVAGVGWSEEDETVTWAHMRSFPEESIHHLASLRSGHEDHFNDTLDSILIPRVPGTAGHRQVRDFIEKQMTSLGWDVEEDGFMAETPLGSKPFINIIATLNKNSCKRLVIACHYDSKISKNDEFLGATDSAVPCSMMINVAWSLNELLRKHRQLSPEQDLSLQFIFFDGEEAFKRWSESDSLYGSRHLAHTWNKSRLSPAEKSICKKNGHNMESQIDRIQVMVLLDLLGMANPSFYSYFYNTNSLYAKIVELERRLNLLGHLQPHAPQSKTSYFKNRATFAMIEDDHVPFMRLGVPIIHLIPSPFPSVWHTNDDDRSCLHHPTIVNLNKILQLFIAEYLQLDSLLYA